MNSRLPLALAAALGVAMAGCNNDPGMSSASGADGPASPDGSPVGAADQTAMTAPTAGEALAEAPVSGPASDTVTLGMAADGNGTLSPATALAAVMVIDEHEVAAAEQAEERDLDDAVEDYAEQMENEHRRNLASTRALLDTTGGAPGADGPALDEMRARHRSERERLAGIEDDDAYQRAWLEAMVTGHTGALELLDMQLIPAAADEPVREHLEQTRQTVARHLETAQQLRDQAAGANR